MRSKPEIKALALANFKRIYWKGVGINLLLMLIVGAVAGVPSAIGVSIASIMEEEMWTIPFMYAGIFLCLAFIVPLSFYGMVLYFGDDRNCNISAILKTGLAKFWRNLGSMVLMTLMIAAWSLLFYIPGIIKYYSYSMTPYILADCPDVKAVDAITISKRMMKGHKWEYFGLQIGFIGWMILNSYTCGLLGIFYVYPYYQATMAGYYVELKKKSVMDGVVTAAQFGGGSLNDMSVPPVVTTNTYNPYMYGQEMNQQPMQQPAQFIQSVQPIQQPAQFIQPAQPMNQQPVQPVQQPVQTMNQQPTQFSQPMQTIQQPMQQMQPMQQVDTTTNIENDPYAAFKPQTESPSYDLKSEFAPTDDIK